MLVLIFLSLGTLKRSLEQESETALANAAQIFYKTIENSYDGAFSVSNDGKLYKGDVNLEDLYVTMDSIKEERDVELTVFWNDTRMLTTLKNDNGDRNVGTQADPDVVELVMSGEYYFDKNLKIGDNDYYAYYLPMHNADGSTCGMVFAGTPSESVDEAISSILISIVMASVVIFVIALVIIILIDNRIAKSVKDVTVVLSEMEKGHLNVDINENVLGRTDEIGEMARCANNVNKTFREMITEIRHEVQNINNCSEKMNEMSLHASTATNEASLAVEEIAKGATLQAEETENATEHIDSIGRIIESIVDNISVLSDSSDEMSKSGVEATRILAELNDSNKKTIEVIKRITKQTEETNTSVQAISNAAEVITSIAEETNLLALNASIEAARAGEHGRGFAVVADSIQKLAEESNNSAREIMDVIGTLIKDSEQTVDTMKEVNQIVEEEGQRVDETKNIIGRVTREIDNSQSQISSVNGKSGTIKAANDEIIEIIQKLAGISRDNAAATEETNASTEELNAMMQELSQGAVELHEVADHVKGFVSRFVV